MGAIAAMAGAAAAAHVKTIHDMPDRSVNPTDIVSDRASIIGRIVHYRRSRFQWLLGDRRVKEVECVQTIDAGDMKFVERKVWRTATAKEWRRVCSYHHVPPADVNIL